MFRIVAGRPVEVRKEPDMLGWPLTIMLALVAMAGVGAFVLFVFSLERIAG